MAASPVQETQETFQLVLNMYWT